MKYAVIDTNVLVSSQMTHHAALALFDDGAVLVTGNKRHFPAADFILTPTEFVEILDTQA